MIPIFRLSPKSGAIADISPLPKSANRRPIFDSPIERGKTVHCITLTATRTIKGRIIDRVRIWRQRDLCSALVRCDAAPAPGQTVVN